MFHILGVILLIIAFVLIFGFVIIYKIVKSVLGRGNKARTGRGESFNRTNQTNSENYTRREERKSSGKKKVFDDDEGEYVEFEEIKD